MEHEFSLDYAQELDNSDPLRQYREQFYAPYLQNKRAIYFLGNSLGLQPKNAQQAVMEIMEGWANFGVEGFFLGADPWLNYNKNITPLLCDIVGATKEEVITMNHLTVNLHLLMICFLQANTVPAIKLSVKQKHSRQTNMHFNRRQNCMALLPATLSVEVYPKESTELITTEDIIACIELHQESVALVLFSGVNYYTGQAFNIKAITAAAHKVGACAGFDLAHAAGNIELQLHDWQVDFACWCNYKYLNSGPGAIGGVFIHEHHLNNKALPRLHGWWGNDVTNRFKMRNTFTPANTAESWAMSTPPMMLLATHKASLDVFAAAGFDRLLQKSKH